MTKKSERSSKKKTSEPAKPVSSSALTLPGWEIQQRISMAIVLIHNCARYFEGMQILCELAGYERNALINQYDSVQERKATREKFNNWVHSLVEQT